MIPIPQPSPILQAALVACGETEAQLANLDGALGRNAQKATAAKADLERETAAQTELDTQLAMEVDESRSKVLETKARKATLAVGEARAQVERYGRLHDALTADRLKTIDLLDEQLKAVETLLVAHNGELANGVDAAIREAAAPLVEVLRQAAVIEQASGRGWLRFMQDELKVPGMRHDRPILSGDRAYAADGTSIRLGADWQSDKSLVELHRAAGGPAEHARKIRQALADARSPLSPAERLAQREREAMARTEEAEITAAEDRRREEIRRRGPTMKGYTVNDGMERQREEARRFAAQRDAHAPDFNTAQTPSPVSDSADHF